MVVSATDNVVELLPAEGDLVRVAPGEYTAVYCRHHGRKVFGVPKLCVEFRLIEHLELLVPRWYCVRDFRAGRVIATRHSDLVREVSAVLGSRIRQDRVPVSSLADVPVRVEVRDVVTDRRQAPLAKVNQYSVIASILGRAL